MSNTDRFRCPEKAGRNVAPLSRAASRIQNLVNSPETVNSGTFDSPVVYSTVRLPTNPTRITDATGPTLLRTNGPVATRTYKRRSAQLNKSRAATSRITSGTSGPGEGSSRRGQLENFSFFFCLKILIPIEEISYVKIMKAHLKLSIYCV